MKQLTILLATFLFAGTMNVFAQNQLKIGDREVLNLGDGQRYAHNKDDNKTPLNGKVRIITGITTEYIDTEFKNGYVDGKWDYFEKNKLKESTTFKDGYVQGEYALYFGSGDVKTSGNFDKGRKDGTWEEFNSDGDKRQTEVFKDDVVVKRITYYLNGNIDTERNFKNGKEDGVTKKYTQEGKLKTEQNYVNGKQVGKQMVHFTSNQGDFVETSNYNEKGKKDGDYSEIFVENKHIKSKGKYKNGQKDGKWTYGYQNGTLYKEEIYNNGVLEETKKL